MDIRIFSSHFRILPKFPQRDPTRTCHHTEEHGVQEEVVMALAAHDYFVDLVDSDDEQEVVIWEVWAN